MLTYRHNGQGAPSEATTVVVNSGSDITAALANNSVNVIQLGSSFTADFNANRLVSLNLNGYTLNGNVSYTTNTPGLITISGNGTIGGNLTITAPNATVHNDATVNGTTNIIAVSYNSYVSTGESKGGIVMLGQGRLNLSGAASLSPVTISTPQLVVLAGTVGTVSVDQANASVKVESDSTVNQVTLTPNAINTKITAESNSTVAAVEVNATGVEIGGEAANAAISGSETPTIVSGVGTINVFVRQGFALNSTAIDGTRPSTGNSYGYLISSSPLSQLPNTGDAAPAGLIPYITGDDILGAVAGDYILLYELDSANNIVNFKQLLVASNNINTMSDWRESITGNQVIFEFNSPLTDATTMKTDPTQVISIFGILDTGSIKVSEQDITSISWDITGNFPKLIVTFNQQLNLTSSYIMGYEFVDGSIVYVNSYGNPSGGSSSVYSSSSEILPLIITNIKDVAGTVEDSSKAYYIDGWLMDLSYDGLQNYKHGMQYIYQKFIAENNATIIATDLSTLQRVIDLANATVVATVNSQAELDAALADTNVRTIQLGSSFTANLNANRLVDIDFNGFTLTGDVSFTSNTWGTLTIKNGTLSGNLTINIPNASFVNSYVTITGTTTVIAVSNQ